MRTDRENPDPHHLIVAFAHASEPACTQALRTLQLPAVQRLWRHGTVVASHAGTAFDLTPPHEHALGTALGWADPGDGRWPWAGWKAGRAGQACAWFTPCHWRAAMDQVTLLPPEDLDLSTDESHALLAALAPLAQEDGLQLMAETPQRWRAEGPLLADLACASLDRVAHRRGDIWLPRNQARHARTLQRLQNEAQMLFYTHPVNEARQARGALPINGFWVSGAGVWDGQGPSFASGLAALAPAGEVRCIDTLRAPALAGDWHGWARAWQALDHELLTPWLTEADPERPRQLTLCGEQGWLRWSSAPPARMRPGLAGALQHRWQRWRARWTGAPTPTPLSHWLEPL